ncbi:MAG: aromatic-ring-hydroxylating dioxygenase subunit beta [Cyanobacteria bacterium P01_D01_bin.1]
MTLHLTHTENPSRYSCYIDDAFYRELTDGLQDWDRESLPVDAPVDMEVRSHCQALLFREAGLLDDGRFDDWLELFFPECLYWVPSVVRGGDPRTEVSIAFDDRRRLEDRIYWLQGGFAYSQTPRSRTSRTISNIEVLQGSTTEAANVRSNFVIHEFRQGEMRSLAGWYGHRLKKQNDRWQIRQKMVNLIDCDQGQDNLTFLL